jgi:subtilase family serine protease
VFLIRAGQRRRITSIVAVVALSGSFVAVGMPPPGYAAAAPARAWVRSTTSVPALPPGSRAVRAVAPATTVHAEVVLGPRDRGALAAFDTAVSTPGSPTFRRYLAPGEFASVFGPSPATVASVRGWLSGSGLTVGPTSGDGLIVPLSGTATQVDHAFGVGLEQYRLPSGRVVRAPDAAPLVPRALAGALEGVVGLDDLNRPVPQLVRSSAASAPRAPRPAAGSRPHAGGPVFLSSCDAGGNQGALTVDQLAQAYSFSGLYPGTEGAGVTVGVYELESFLPTDITNFENCYSPTINASVSSIGVDGAHPNGNAGAGEAALDIEMTVGMAPAANVTVYVGPNAGTGPLDTYAQMVTDDTVQVITTSWGQCEAQLAPGEIHAESTLFQQAVAQGQTVVAASGDEGSEDCYVFPSSIDTRLAVDDPSSQPWVTGVGGTTLNALGPAPTESVWNSGLLAGTSGGGSSHTWTMPSWQRGPGVQSLYSRSGNAFTGSQPCGASAGAGTLSCRQVPDVSADADPRTGLAVYCSCFAGHWARIGGTSMASPLWGALVALADQGHPRVGFVDPALYQAPCAAVPAFNDVMAGDNEPLGSAPGDPPRVPSGPYFPATAGYDMATGLGTPIADALVGLLRSPPPSSCPVVTGISASSGPAAGATAVTVTGSNLSGVTEVDFGNGNPGVIASATPNAVTVRTPPSPTRGWDGTEVIVRAGIDAIGFDGSLPFTYLGPRGYWTVASDGGMFSFGQMGFYGSMGGRRLAQPIVGMAPTPSSKGYWLVASDGGIFAFGDAGFHGSTGNLRLTKPVVGMASTPDGGGYWLVASDGGIFSFGDAGFHGSTGSIRLTKPVVGMAATFDGYGYWLVASDGGIFAFDGRYGGFSGSMGGTALAQPMVGIGAP